jgi:2-polyprenyl-3-methyl-5-hydroxy-6-metoxy-1,4-benzoquinol methylase
MDSKDMKSILKFHIKGLMGIILGLIFPNKLKLVERYATIPWLYKPGFRKLELIIRAGLFYSKAANANKHNKLMDLHQHFWKNQLATEYYANTKSRFQETFIPHFSKYLDILDLLTINKNIQAICEIGTGDGQLLSHLASRWPTIECIGLDLSRDQIELNKHTYKKQNIEFYSGDAIDWINAQEPKATLYITGLGVLEYFEYIKLIALFRTIRDKPVGNMMLLTEPVYDNVNMDKDFESFSAGSEQSFTHAYPKILEREGWNIINNDVVLAVEHRFWVGIATNSNG